jgi:hypothetical protein
VAAAEATLIVTHQVITIRDMAATVSLGGLHPEYTTLADLRIIVHLVLAALVQIFITTVPTFMTEDLMAKVVFA